MVLSGSDKRSAVVSLGLVQDRKYVPRAAKTHDLLTLWLILIWCSMACRSSSVDMELMPTSSLIDEPQQH